MPLLFPDLDTLRLVLSSNTVSSKTANAPVHVTRVKDGRIVLNSQIAPSRSELAAMKKLGVRSTTSAAQRHFPNWYAALPLEQTSGALAIGERTPVIFILNTSQQFVEMASEALRLGNDRQSFQCLTLTKKTTLAENESSPKQSALSETVDSGERFLLKMIGPPYYTLLRATEHATRQGSTSSPESQVHAFVEQAPRVWIELGFTHPFAAALQPAANHSLFISAAHWWVIPDRPLQEIYRIADIQLAIPNETLTPIDFEAKIDVPLSLVRSAGNRATASLWIIRRNTIPQIEQFLRSADDRLINQLSFVVAQPEQDGAPPCVLIRLRPGKTAPPVLVLDALECDAYQKLPNLFVPCGMRIHPPLRRDLIAKLLAGNPEQLFWLEPLEDRSCFRPFSVPDNAFRPLSDWLEYVLSEAHQSLTAWSSTFRFDFEPFVCPDEQPDRSQTKESQERRTGSDKKKQGAAANPTFQSPGQTAEVAEFETSTDQSDADFAAQPDWKPSELQQKLRQMEQYFLESTEPLENRCALWHEMAMLNLRLKNRSDATICWANYFWNAPVSSLEWKQWLDCEQSHFEKPVAIDSLEPLLTAQPISIHEANRLVAWLCHQASLPDRNPQLQQKLPAISLFVQAVEPQMSVRVNWLAWQAIHRLSGGDVLGMARARDRALERLYRGGLGAEFDLPLFLRSGTGEQSNRFRRLLDQVLALRESVGYWVHDPSFNTGARTTAYSELIFAFGLARMGEKTFSREIVEEVKSELLKRDHIHRWAFDAYEYRIEQAHNHVDLGEPLDETLMGELEKMERTDRYRLDRLRNRSRVLEPHQRINPYERWHNQFPDELSRQLADWSRLTGRGDLITAVNALLNDAQVQADSDKLARVLSAALDVAPRLGLDFAVTLLPRIEPVLQQTELVARVLLLERAMRVAAHFGDIAFVQLFFGLFDRELQNIVEMFTTTVTKYSAPQKSNLEIMQSLFSQSFRGLRKLGLSDEINRLFERVVHLVGKRNRKSDPTLQHRRLQLLLHVAGSWFYFNQHERATQIVEEAYELLVSGSLPESDQLDLACNYVSAVSLAPSDVALQKLQQLFEFDMDDADHPRRRLEKISDNMMTGSHYSLAKITLIETMILSLVSDEFSLNPEIRKYLDEDEYLVRKRIHHDMQLALKQTDG